MFFNDVYMKNGKPVNNTDLPDSRNVILLVGVKVRISYFKY